MFHKQSSSINFHEIVFSAEFQSTKLSFSIFSVSPKMRLEHYSLIILRRRNVKWERENVNNCVKTPCWHVGIVLVVLLPGLTTLDDSIAPYGRQNLHVCSAPLLFPTSFPLRLFE